MSEEERVTALARTYLHEIGLTERPRNENVGDSNPFEDDVFGIDEESSPFDSMEHLGRLLSLLSQEAPRQFTELGRQGPLDEERFHAAQEVVAELDTEASNKEDRTLLSLNGSRSVSFAAPRSTVGACCSV